MNRKLALRSILFGSLTLGFGACVGQVPGGEGDPQANADGGASGADAGPAADAGEEIPAVLSVSGKVIDYFAANLGGVPVVANASLTTVGLEPAVDVQADALGAFTMDVLPSSLFYVNTAATGYAPSRNAATQLLDVPLEQNQYAASLVGIARQYAGAGGLEPIVPTDGNGVIMLELVRNNGNPAVDIPIENIVLASAAAPLIPIGTAYLVDPLTTDLSPNDVTLVSAVDGNNRARAGFLDVPPGDYTITTTIVGGGGGGGGGGDGGIQTVAVTVGLNGVTFANSAGVASAGAGGGSGAAATIVLDPNAPLGFTEDIYPILQTVATGGDGCVGCHDANHLLPFTGTPEETLALLLLDAIEPAGVPRINLLSPADSPFVTNPVYEAIPNHPNAFWTVNSNHYKGAIAWIAQGAALLRADAVLPEPPPE